MSCSRKYQLAHLHTKLYSKNQSGTALVTSLLLLSLTAIICIKLYRVNNDLLEQTQSYLNNIQAVEYALGAEQYIKMVLENDMKTTSKMDHLNEKWASSNLDFRPPRGKIRIRVVDLNSKFDLNSMLTKKGKIRGSKLNQLTKLLSNQGVNKNLALEIADWLDADSDPRSNNSEDFLSNSKGLSQHWNRRLVSNTQLFRLKNFSFDEYLKIEPFITTGSQNMNYNFNTTSKEVNEALGKKHSLVMKKRPIKMARSDWFKATIDVEIENFKLSLESTLYRKKSQAVVTYNRVITSSSIRGTSR